MAARAPWPRSPRSSGGGAPSDEAVVEDSDPANSDRADVSDDPGLIDAPPSPRTPTHRPSALRAPGSREVRVASVKRVRSVPGLYEIKWRDGKRRRRAMTLIDDWTGADDAVCAAVAAAYPEHDRPSVFLPIQAWR